MQEGISQVQVSHNLHPRAPTLDFTGLNRWPGVGQQGRMSGLYQADMCTAGEETKLFKLKGHSLAATCLDTCVHSFSAGGRLARFQPHSRIRISAVQDQAHEVKEIGMK